MILFFRRHRWKILFAAVLSGLTVTGTGAFRLGARLRAMENRMAYIQDTTDVVQNEVGSLQANIEKTLRKENSFLEEYKVEITRVNIEDETYTLSVQAVPKEFSDSTGMVIYFGTKPFLMEKDGFHYRAQVTLPMDQSYDGNVTVLINNGKKRNTEILEDYEGYPTMIRGCLSGKLVANRPAYRDGTFEYDGMVSYELEAKDMFQARKFKSLCLVAETGGLELYKEQLITEECIEENSDNYAGPVTTEIPSIQWTEPTEAATEGERKTRRQESREKERESAGMVTGLKGETALRLEEELQQGQKVDIYLEAVSNNGYRLRRYLFSGTADGSAENGFRTTDEDRFVLIVGQKRYIFP